MEIAMSKESMKAKIDKIMNDTRLSLKEQINHLKKMHADVRAEMRAASESDLVTDNDIGAELKQLDEALDSLNQKAASPEDGGGATL